MKSIIAIGIALAFLLLPGCSKEVKKDDQKLEEPKNGETPAWSKFPMPDEEDEKKEEENDE
jgi:hypothetical protein